MPRLLVPRQAATSPAIASVAAAGPVHRRLGGPDLQGEIGPAAAAEPDPDTRWLAAARRPRPRPSGSRVQRSTLARGQGRQPGTLDRDWHRARRCR